MSYGLGMARAGFWAIESHPIRFGKDGRWYAGDEPIANPRIAALFSRHITRGPDGAFWLIVGDERAKIEVEDTPFVVTRVDGDPGRGFRVHLNDDSEEPLEPESLELGEGEVLYCAVKRGEHPARFLRPAQLELFSHVREDGAGRFVLPLPGGQAQAIRRGRG